MSEAKQKYEQPTDIAKTVSLKQVLDSRRDYCKYLGAHWLCSQCEESAEKRARPLITITNKTTVEEALLKMRTHNVTCLVVVDEKERSRFLGIVNIYDVLVAIVFQPCFDKYLTTPPEEAKNPAKLVEIFKDTCNSAVFTVPVVELLGVSAESYRLWMFEDDVLLCTLADTMSKAIHRVLVVPSLKTIESEQDPKKLSEVVSIHEALTEPTSRLARPRKPKTPSTSDGKTAYPTVVTKDEGIIEPAVPPKSGLLLTQSDLAAYLYSRRSELPVFEKSLSELKLGAKDHKEKDAPAVVTVKTHESALTGFRRLMQWKTGLGDLVALPVVGESGVVLSVLSASDLRSITKLTLSTLLLPVLEYLALTRGGLRSAVTCRPGDTLGDALQKILQAKVHRAFVVDAGMQVTGVLSLSDVLGLFADLPAWGAAKDVVYED